MLAFGGTRQGFLSKPGCVVVGVCRCDGCTAHACQLFCVSRFLKGVARLADISLHDPVSISVLDESHDVSSPESEAFLEASPPQATDELDGFAIPAGLEQHVVVVPSKLRLVCLAAFILQKCKVGLRAGPALILKGPQCCYVRHGGQRTEMHMEVSQRHCGGECRP